MKSRMFWYALLVGATSMTSGCYWFRSHFPNVGWRLQHVGPACGPVCGPPCGPVCAPACSSPILGRPPVVVPGGPDCVGCNGGVPSVGPPGDHHPPAGHPAFGYPQGPYPPVIGNPVPLPGAGGPASERLPNPMPVPKGTGN